jgi:hypothetical protein
MNKIQDLDIYHKLLIINPSAAQALVNLYPSGYSRPCSVHINLPTMFTWSGTIQGHSYWANLAKIIRDKDWATPDWWKLTSKGNIKPQHKGETQ